MIRHILLILAILLFLVGCLELFPYLFMYNTQFLVKHYEKKDSEEDQGWKSSFRFTCMNIGLALFISLILTSSLNPLLRLVSIIVILVVFYGIIPFLFINLCNLCIQAFSTNGPFLSHKEMRDMFPDSALLESQWEKIKWEYECFNKSFESSCFHKNVPGFRLDKAEADSCWRTVFVKKQGRLDKNMEKYFPITQTLVSHPSIHNAMFSVLDPGVSIPGHVGYFKGYLRYHLGIVIPSKPSPPFITVGGQKHEWKEGEGVMFDDMFYHFVSNEAEDQRVVLFIDVLRPGLPVMPARVRDLAAFYIEHNPTLKMFVKNQHKPVENST